MSTVYSQTKIESNLEGSKHVQIGFDEVNQEVTAPCLEIQKMLPQWSPLYQACLKMHGEVYYFLNKREIIKQMLIKI